MAASDENLRLNPNDGTLTATDTPLSYNAADVNAGANPNVVGAAYTNSFAPSPRTPPPGTTLYLIDSALDILATQIPTNAGILNTVGALGFNFGERLSFDISGATGVAYLFDPDLGSFGVESGLNSFGSINLSTGAFTGGGVVPGADILGFAVADVPAPGGLALFGLGVLGCALAGRRRAEPATGGR